VLLRVPVDRGAVKTLAAPEGINRMGHIRLQPNGKHAMFHTSVPALDITNALVLNVRMKKPARVLGLQELQIMNVVWDRGRVTVRDVYETLRERRQIAYTTVMTMMTILAQKGFLKRTPGEDRAFVYEPARSRQTVMRATVNDFLDRVFGGSANPLMLHLIQDKRLTEKDLDELRRAIRKKSGAS